MRALVIGASGLVGSGLLRSIGSTAIGTYRTRARDGLRPIDAGDPVALAALLDAARPEVVFFPAAEPNVDWCEEHPAGSYERNVGPALVALEATRERGARFVFFSSDYVFDGGSGPYSEEDVPAPIQVYGRHKLEIEEQVLRADGTVVRTTTVYGEEAPPPKNFVLRLVARLRAGERVTVPSDQISTPTWVDDLSAATVAVAERGGIWHVAGPTLLARDAFARIVARTFDLDEALIDAVPTSALRQRAARPLRGGLRTEKLAAAIGRRLLEPTEALARLRARLEP